MREFYFALHLHSFCVFVIRLGCEHMQMTEVCLRLTEADLDGQDILERKRG